ncbi:hypothetical protein C8R43DRAFT_965624 [Mycena crocata]|nr:hypothetical protein C8R43DRAFT_965624 [Mycena crocata]
MRSTYTWEFSAWNFPGTCREASQVTRREDDGAGQDSRSVGSCWQLPNNDNGIGVTGLPCLPPCLLRLPAILLEPMFGTVFPFACDPKTPNSCDRRAAITDSIARLRRLVTAYLCHLKAIDDAVDLGTLRGNGRRIASEVFARELQGRLPPGVNNELHNDHLAIELFDHLNDGVGMSCDNAPPVSEPFFSVVGAMERRWEPADSLHGSNVSWETCSTPFATRLDFFDEEQGGEVATLHALALSDGFDARVDSAEKRPHDDEEIDIRRPKRKHGC